MDKIIRHRILGTNVVKLTTNGLLRLIEDAIKSANKTVIAYQNLHGIFLTYTDVHMEKFYDGNVITIIDGMPLILIGKMLGHDLSKANRLAWIDFMHPLFSLIKEKEWRVFYLGTTNETNRNAQAKLYELYGLNIECQNGFFNANIDSEDNKRIVNQINQMKPHLLIVGMGMPRQEFWIAENRDNLNANVIITCGAALEFLGGVVKPPPRWLGSLGLEWAYRFMGNPGKLWYRYLIEPWHLLFLILKQGLR